MAQNARPIPSTVARAGAALPGGRPGRLRRPRPAPRAARRNRDLARDGRRHLPEKYRLPLGYSAIDRLDYDTIATVLGVPLGTVKTLVFRGKRMLKDRIRAFL